MQKRKSTEHGYEVEPPLKRAFAEAFKGYKKGAAPVQMFKNGRIFTRKKYEASEGKVEFNKMINDIKEFGMLFI